MKKATKVGESYEKIRDFSVILKHYASCALLKERKMNILLNDAHTSYILGKLVEERLLMQ